LMGASGEASVTTLSLSRLFVLGFRNIYVGVRRISNLSLFRPFLSRHLCPVPRDVEIGGRLGIFSKLFYDQLICFYDAILRVPNP
jgi:hypothetical protein